MSTGLEAYPDWQRYTQWDGPELFSHATSPLILPGGPQILPMIYVGNFPYIAGSLEPHIVSMTAHFEFYADAAGQQFLGSLDYAIESSGVAGAVWHCRLPTLGPYLLLTLTTTGAGSVFGTLYASMRAAGTPVLPFKPVLLTVSASMAASSSTDYPLSTYHQGRAKAYVSMTAGGAYMLLFEMDVTTRAYINTQGFQLTPNLDTQEFAMGGSAALVRIINRTAGVQNFVMALVADLTY